MTAEFTNYIFDKYQGNIIAPIHQSANYDTLEKLKFMVLCAKAADDNNTITEYEGALADAYNEICDIFKNNRPGMISNVSTMGLLVFIIMLH